MGRNGRVSSLGRNGNMRFTADIGTEPLSEAHAMEIRRSMGTRSSASVESARESRALFEARQEGLRRGYEAVLRQGRERADEVARLMAVANPTPEQVAAAVKALDVNSAKEISVASWARAGEEPAAGAQRLNDARDWVAKNMQKFQARYEELLAASVRTPSAAVDSELRQLTSALKGKLDTQAGRRVFREVSAAQEAAQEAERAARNALWEKEEAARQMARRQADDLERVARRIQQDQAEAAARTAQEAQQAAQRAQLTELAQGVTSRRASSLVDAASSLREAEANLALARRTGKYVQEAQDAVNMATKYRDTVTALDLAERQLMAAKNAGQLNVVDDLSREVASLARAESKINGEIFRTSQYWKKPLNEAAAAIDDGARVAAASNKADAVASSAEAGVASKPTLRERFKRFFGRGTQEELKAAESALAACSVGGGPGRGLLAFCTHRERRALRETVARLRARFQTSLARAGAAADRIGASIGARGAAVAERLGVGAGSRAARVAGQVGNGLRSAKTAIGDGLRAAGPTLKTLGKAAAWIQAGHALAENMKDQAKFNDEVKETGVINDEKLADLAYGYTTDLLLSHGGTKSAIAATKSCFSGGAWSCTKKVGSGLGHVTVAVGKATGNCIIHPWECAKKIGGGLKSFGVGVAKWTKGTGEAAGDRVYKWVDEAERKKSCGRRHGTFDRLVMGATGGLYGKQGRFTTKTECDKADKEDANWNKAWNNWALEKGERVDKSKYNPLNWFGRKDEGKKTQEGDSKGSKWNPLNWLNKRTAVPTTAAAASPVTTVAPATPAPQSTLSKLNPLNWFSAKDQQKSDSEPKKERSWLKPSTWF